MANRIQTCVVILIHISTKRFTVKYILQQNVYKSLFIFWIHRIFYKAVQYSRNKAVVMVCIKFLKCEVKFGIVQKYILSKNTWLLIGFTSAYM